MKLNDKVIVVILFLLAFFIRLYGISEHGLFADEITWMVRGKEFFFALKQLNLNYFFNGYWLDKSTTWPIAFPMSLLSGTMLVFFAPGQSSKSFAFLSDITAGRLPAVLIGALFISSLYLLTKNYLGKKVSFVASILLCFEPVSLALGRWVSQDLMLAFASFLSLIFFLKKKSFKSLLISALFCSLAILTKPQGGVVAVAVFIFMITEKKKEIKKFLSWSLFTALITTVLFPFLWNNPFKMILYLQTQMQAASNLAPPVNFFGRITSSPPWNYYLFTLPFHLTETVLIGIIASLIAFAFYVREKRPKVPAFLKICLIYSFIFLLVISLSNQKLGIRYAFPLWPYLCLLSGFGIVKIGDYLKGYWQKAYWILIFIPLIGGVIKFYPSFYLYHNNFISSKNYQNMESVGFCDGVKPAMVYLAPYLYEGIKILFYDCDASANYYSGYTIGHVYDIKDKPQYVVIETYSSQKDPSVEKSVLTNNYHLIKNIVFQGINLAKIYSR